MGSIIHKVIDGVSGGKSFVEQEIEFREVFLFFSLFFRFKDFGLG